MRTPPSPARVLVATLLALVSAAAGCRRPPAVAPPPAPALDAGPEDHCYWAAFRTALPPDSVAVRSARAHTALGLTRARSARLSDTAWADAGPTALATAERRGVFAARVVAFRRGDTTVFRTFVAAAPLPGTAPDTAPETYNDAEALISFCGAIGRTAQAGGTAPRAEERDDSLPQWRRRP